MTRALGVMGLAEMVNRVSRILTAIALAHILSPAEFGIVAIALTSADLIRVLTSTGLGARIVQCADEELESVSNASYSLNWHMHLAVAGLQLVLAYPIAQAYGANEIGWLIAALAVPYLFYPLAAVQVYRLQRDNRMGVTAFMLATQISLDNLMTALLVLCGAGLAGIAIPKIAVCLVWVIAYRKLCSWRPNQQADTRVARRTTFKFGGLVLLTELTGALRQNADKLIIGQVAGLELLGVYYFAFNAGLGITTGLVNAFSTALLPHFSRHRGNSRMIEFWKAAGLVSAIAMAVIGCQMAVAPYYVPLLFGARWSDSVPLLILLCASGLTMALWRSTTQFARAAGSPGLELRMTAIYSILSIATVLLTVPYGLLAVAGGQVVVNLIVIPACAVWLTLSPIQQPALENT